jgi:hypothetical protein
VVFFPTPEYLGEARISDRGKNSISLVLTNKPKNDGFIVVLIQMLSELGEELGIYEPRSTMLKVQYRAKKSREPKEGELEEFINLHWNNWVAELITLDCEKMMDNQNLIGADEIDFLVEAQESKFEKNNQEDATQNSSPTVPSGSPFPFSPSEVQEQSPNLPKLSKLSLFHVSPNRGDGDIIVNCGGIGFLTSPHFRVYFNRVVCLFKVISDHEMEVHIPRRVSLDGCLTVHPNPSKITVASLERLSNSVKFWYDQEEIEGKSMAGIVLTFSKKINCLKY